MRYNIPQKIHANLLYKWIFYAICNLHAIPFFMRIPGIHCCYLSVHSIMHSAIPFAWIFHSASYYGYDVNVALLAFIYVRCSFLCHYNFTHIFYFIRNVWHQQHQLNGRPQSKHSSLNGLKLFVCNIFTSWLFFPTVALWRQSDRFSFHISTMRNFTWAQWQNEEKLYAGEENCLFSVAFSSSARFSK